MSESKPPHPSDVGSARARALFADFYARHEAWLKQIHELTRVRDEALSAAEHEIAAIVAVARDQIKRAVLDARRELQSLSGDLQTAEAMRADVEVLMDALERRRVAGSDSARSIDRAAASDSILKARHDLRRLLQEVHPELDTLSARVPSSTPPPALNRPQDQPPAPNVREAQFGLGRRDTQDWDKLRTTSQSQQTDAPSDPPYRPRPGKTFLSIAIVAGSLAAGGGGWWMTQTAHAEASSPGPAITAPSRAPEVSALAPTVTTRLETNAIPPSSSTSPVRPTLVPASARAERSSLWLQITAHRQAWIKATIDEGAAQSRLLQPGETRRLLGDRRVSIVVGDAGAVSVSFNGGPFTVPGRDGQVVTRNYTGEDAERIHLSQARAGTSAATATTGLAASVTAAAR
jgi:uncharacterized protein DUF4115